MSYTLVKLAVPRAMRKQLRPIRRFAADAARHPGLWLLRIPLARDVLAAAAPPKPPPILVISLPRAGSSWIGSIIGASEGALYLREPVTQSYIREVTRINRVVFEPELCKDRRAYDRLASLAFKGVPRFHPGVIPYAEQWTVRRTQKRVVIKEVNPLALDHWQQAFRPKVIYLLRHPIAVARSHHALGWVRDPFSQRFRPETLADFGADLSLLSRATFWEQIGALQAIVENHTLKTLGRSTHLLVRYEDICRDPARQFARLLEFCELPFSDHVQEAIARSTKTATDYAPGRYDTVRDSSSMTERWRHEATAEEVELVRRGYFANHPHFYTEEGEWQA